MKTDSPSRERAGLRKSCLQVVAGFNAAQTKHIRIEDVQVVSNFEARFQSHQKNKAGLSDRH
jgi:hypothetical protein